MIVDMHFSVFFTNLLFQIKCMELKRAEHIAFPDKESIMKEGEPQQGSSSGLCSSVEVKDAYLPPWVICSLCALLSSEGRSFEARYNILI